MNGEENNDEEMRFIQQEDMFRACGEDGEPSAHKQIIVSY